MRLHQPPIDTLGCLEVDSRSRVVMRSRPDGASLLPFVVWLLAITTLAVLCLPALASGQTRDQVAAEIEKTDRMLEQARDLLAETGAPRGHMSLNLAERLQNQAHEAFNRGQLRAALGLTLESRDHILRSLSGIRRSEDNQDAVERELERTDRVLEEANDRLETGNTGMRRWEAAKQIQTRAWELYRERRLRPALKLTLEAREAAARLAMRTGGGSAGMGEGLGARGDRIDATLERLSMWLDQLGERIEPGNQRGQEELAVARSSYEAAVGAHTQGQDMLAERHLRRTREAMLNALRTIEDRLQKDEIRSLISDARRRWEAIGDDLEGSNDSRLADWHRQAGADLDGAEDAMERGELKRALVQTRSAFGLLDRIRTELGY